MEAVCQDKNHDVSAVVSLQQHHIREGRAPIGDDQSYFLQHATLDSVIHSNLYLNRKEPLKASSPF